MKNGQNLFNNFTVMLELRRVSLQIRHFCILIVAAFVYNSMVHSISLSFQINHYRLEFSLEIPIFINAEWVQFKLLLFNPIWLWHSFSLTWKRSFKIQSELLNWFRLINKNMYKEANTIWYTGALNACVAI